MLGQETLKENQPKQQTANSKSLVNIGREQEPMKSDIGNFKKNQVKLRGKCQDIIEFKNLMHPTEDRIKYEEEETQENKE